MGGGRDAALQLGRECEQPPQILCCGPCYIRGFSRVTSAPQLASDLVSTAALSRPEGYCDGELEGTIPEVTPCTTPWVLLPGDRKRETERGLEGLWAGLCHALWPGPQQGSASQGSILPAPQPGRARAARAPSTHLAPHKAPPAPAAPQAGAALGHCHVPGKQRPQDPAP